MTRDYVLRPQDMASIIHTYVNNLPMLVVFGPYTEDYPGRWVARLRLALPKDLPTAYVLLGATKQELVDQIPGWMTKLDRDPTDDPTIEEVWL